MVDVEIPCLRAPSPFCTDVLALKPTTFEQQLFQAFGDVSTGARILQPKIGRGRDLFVWIVFSQIVLHKCFEDASPLPFGYLMREEFSDSFELVVQMGGNAQTVAIALSPQILDSGRRSIGSFDLLVEVAKSFACLALALTTHAAQQRLPSMPSEIRTG
jgi:hypothetical protein